MHTLRILIAVVVAVWWLPVSAQKKKPAIEGSEQAFAQTLISAHKEMALGNDDKATELFMQCTILLPQNAVPHYKLSQLYIKARKRQEALREIEHAVALDNTNKWYYLHQARLLAEMNRYEASAKAYEHVIALDDATHELYFEAALMYASAGKYSKSLALMDRLEARTGLNEEIALHRERFYLAQNKLKKAIAEMQRLCEAFPQEMRYVGMLAEIYAANKQQDKAFELYNYILEREPDNGFAHFAIADYWREKGEHGKAFEATRKGFADSRVDVKPKLNMLMAYLNVAGSDKGLKEEAFALAEILTETHPDEAAAHVIYGDLLVTDRQYKEARDQYSLALLMEQNRFAVWQQLIMCSAELYDFARMAKDGDRALELFPAMPELYLWTAMARYQTKEYDRTVALCRAGLQLGLANVNQQVQLLSHLGDAAHFTQQHSLSDSAYEAALRIDGANTYVLNNYAYFLSVRGEKLERALEMSARTLETTPESPTYLDTYGWILYRMGRYKEALEQLEKAIARDKESAEVTEHYADALYRNGRENEAVDYWKKAKEQGGDALRLDQKIRERKIR
jgi:tetratricopeptide (TPR) repeat protein